MFYTNTQQALQKELLQLLRKHELVRGVLKLEEDCEERREFEYLLDVLSSQWSLIMV